MVSIYGGSDKEVPSCSSSASQMCHSMTFSGEMQPSPRLIVGGRCRIAFWVVGGMVRDVGCATQFVPCFRRFRSTSHHPPRRPLLPFAAQPHLTLNSASVHFLSTITLINQTIHIFPFSRYISFSLSTPLSIPNIPPSTARHFSTTTNATVRRYERVKIIGASHNITPGVCG